MLRPLRAEGLPLGGDRPGGRASARVLLTRAIDVAVLVPKLELDRPFTYLVPEGMEAPFGHLVSVPFHGRTLKGYVIGEASEVPSRVRPLRKVLSASPIFDRSSLELYRWMSHRYLVPLSTVIGSAHPPRVASEEGTPAPKAARVPAPDSRRVLGRYEGGEALVESAGAGSGSFVVRPLPDEEAAAAVEAVAACLRGGRDAVVVVPEAEPLPATAGAVLDVFGESAVLFAGGEPRARYRVWLDVLGGRYRVVVGTRPSVFAPVPRPGLVWIHREAHPGHREQRAPYHSTREVAVARATIQGATAVLAGLSPSAESVALAERGEARLIRPPRRLEREHGPVVETARATEGDRSARLAELLKASRGGALLVSRRGYGVARVCRDCGEPARCPRCSGHVVIREGLPFCAVCGAPASCPRCGGVRFGVERGGTERLEEWAGKIAPVPVRRVEDASAAVPPRDGFIEVGTAAMVKDFGPRRVDLVAVVDADRARRRPGFRAGEQTLATWMEAAAWAGPRAGGGRVLAHTGDPGDPIVQALVRWDPWHYHRAEARRRGEAGFPPGFPVFRVRGTRGLGEALLTQNPVTLLESSLGDETICLVSVRPESLSALGEEIRGLAGDGVVTRVEAEPHL